MTNRMNWTKLNCFKTNLVIEPGNRLTLSELPFAEGTAVEILILSNDEAADKRGITKSSEETESEN